jgi:uncharacterized protein YkwD
VVCAIVSTAGVVAFARQPAAGSHAPTASLQPLALDACCPADPTVDAPHKPIYPTPSPSPSPTPPPAPAPAPVVSRPAPAPAAPARPALVVNSTQQALINQDRARYGLPPLTWSSCLSNIARAQAAHLATPGVTFQHYGGAQQDLGCHLGYQAGENIGWWSAGINDSQLNTMFMNSPDHRANILGPYHYVATAWVVGSNGYGYIAVELS